MLRNFRFSKVQIYMCRFGEQVGSLACVLNQQVAHDDIGSHFHQSAGCEVEQFLILSFFNGVGAGFELVGHLFQTGHQRFHFR